MKFDFNRRKIEFHRNRRKIEFHKYRQTTNMEQTFFLIKPHVSNEDCDKIIDRLNSEGFLIEDSRVKVFPVDHWKLHYQEHHGRDFFEDLCSSMADQEVMYFILSSEDSTVVKLRKLLGATDPSKAEVGTLRNEFGESVRKNAAHASDSLESAQREIKLWFG